ncbi:MAG: DUF1559 domain-containing protein, partial [Thermoguttaceae bacterium]|nr:DUF1559 domain-containing protein [Thermoguttaceae bacterium]
MTETIFHETVPQEKIRTRSKKILSFLLALAVVCVFVHSYRDKSASMIQADDLKTASHEEGEIVDYRALFYAVQDKEYGPPEENGWRLILQALGPRALEQVDLAETVPWEDFPTNDASKEWFNGQWTWLCKKFKLDPHKRPTMLDRMPLWGYVGKYGLTGKEPEPGKNDFKGFYYEKGQKHPARIDSGRAYDTLMAKPWTAKEYPVAAKWIEENADFYDLLAKAARSPKLGCWHYVPKSEKGGFIGTLLPDVQATREFARLLQIRACYRVGSGDLSGAIDDVETITLFGSALFKPEMGCLVERLVGLSCLGVAFGVPLFENPDVPPTKKEIARIAELRASVYRSCLTEDACQRALKGEATFFGYGAYADLLAMRRQGKPVWQYFYGSDEPISAPEKLFGWFLFNAPQVDDAKSFQIFKKLYDSVLEDKEGDALIKIHQKSTSPSLLTRSTEEKLAVIAASQFVPAVNAAKEAFSRMGCVARIGTITAALYAYRADHGTLPPAFTVDKNGKPLHSWRVLILPYLGDDAKALYNKLRLDEPWDSEYNRAFHAQLPDVFCCPSAKDLKSGETIYSVLLGEEGLFDESGVGKDFIKTTKLPNRDVWNQFLVVERSDAVCWMNPVMELRIADFVVDGKTNVAKFFESCRHNGGLNYSNLAGRSIFISEVDTEVTLEACFLGLPMDIEDDEFVTAEEMTTEETTTEETTTEETTTEETTTEETTTEET